MKKNIKILFILVAIFLLVIFSPFIVFYALGGLIPFIFILSIYIFISYIFFNSINKIFRKKNDNSKKEGIDYVAVLFLLVMFGFLYGVGYISQIF